MQVEVETKVGALGECWVIGTRPPSTPAGPKWPTETSVTPPSGGSYRRFPCATAYKCAVFTNAVHVQSRQWMHPPRIFSLAPRSPFLFIIVLLRRFMLIRRETSRLDDMGNNRGVLWRIASNLSSWPLSCVTNNCSKNIFVASPTSATNRFYIFYIYIQITAYIKMYWNLQF